MHNKIKLYTDKQNCCGCGACENICPHGAITMLKDALGFFYPQIDNSICVGCALCTKICAFYDEGESNVAPLSAYAAVSKDQEILKCSTSGGVFAELANYILRRNGIVFGCGYDDKWVAKHIEISSIVDLHKLQGSKYVQSDVGDTFVKVKEYLNNGKKVLYSGTPCQISALRKFLKKDYENFYCIDIVCHGVGSPKLFEEDLKYLCGAQKIRFVDFRSKETGWGTSGVIYTDKKQVKLDIVHSAYYYYYLENSIYRDSCYNCRYASEKRVGDLTLGDYWRIESAHPGIEKEIDLKKGVSCVLVNTQKGEELLNKIKDNLKLIQSKYKSIRERNGQLVKCCSKPANRDNIFTIYQNEGYMAVVRDWKRKTWRKRVVLRIKGFVPQKVRTIIKKHLI